MPREWYSIAMTGSIWEVAGIRKTHRNKLWRDWKNHWHWGVRGRNSASFKMDGTSRWKRLCLTKIENFAWRCPKDGTRISDKLQGKQEKDRKKGSRPSFHIAILRRLGGSVMRRSLSFPTQYTQSYLYLSLGSSLTLALAPLGKHDIKFSYRGNYDWGDATIVRL